MTSNPVPGVSEEAAEEHACLKYLQHNPEFFERHPQILARLRLRHPRNGATVSLIERQVEVLRRQQQEQEQKVAEFVRVARANTLLAEKIHRFTRRLLRAAVRPGAGREALLAELEAALREDFDGVQAVLVMPSAESPAAGESPRFLRLVPVDDPSYRSFDALFAAGRPRCGQVRDSQREFLFGAETPIGSVALVPLGGEPPVGLLALGSIDRDRFHTGMSTEFLARMGELIADSLPRS